jgi:hypothetical protein
MTKDDGTHQLIKDDGANQLTKDDGARQALIRFPRYAGSRSSSDQMAMHVAFF